MDRLPIPSHEFFKTLRYNFTTCHGKKLSIYFCMTLLRLWWNIAFQDVHIINVDQIPSKFVNVDRMTMAEKGSKHVSKKGADDKRAITVTLSQTLNGLMLPFQLIYTGKTKRSLPRANFPTGFCLSFNPSHCSNENEALKLLDQVIKLYIESVKETLNLPDNQKTLLLCDAFKAQECSSVKVKLGELKIVVVQIPKNMTHLLQPLDLTTNLIFKILEKQSFSKYFTDVITDALADDPDRDVTTIDVDMKLSTMKPLHARCMGETYSYLLSPCGRRIIISGWEASGILQAVSEARIGLMPELDPFLWLLWIIF